MNTCDYRNYCEVDLGAIAHNVREIRNILDNNTTIMGVVKADAYGHGAVKTAEVLIKNGVQYLAVATIEEALEIRRVLDVQLLNLGFVPDSQISNAIDNDITLTIFSSDIARKISNCAVKLNKRAKVHIKIDTGMNRIGFLQSQLEEVIEVSQLPGLDIEGIFTHFSCSDSDSEYTERQFLSFVGISNELSKYFSVRYKHCCNSSAIINFPHMHMNMVRPGLILYGLYPHAGIDKNKINLMPAMSFKTELIHIKRVPTGSKISYGGDYTTNRDTIVGTIPVGYADGYSRSLSNNVSVLLNGEFAKVLGKICMDNCMIEISNIKDAKLEDEVVLFGRQGKNDISVDEIAHKLGTINYEVVCSIGKRVKRIYKEIDT